MHGEHFSLMLLPRLNGEFVKRDVKELDGAIAGGDDDLILVRFRPGKVVEGVIFPRQFRSMSD